MPFVFRNTFTAFAVSPSKLPVTGVAKPSFRRPRWSSSTLTPLEPPPACQLTTWIVSLRLRNLA